jgi:hypothetical protein
MRTYLFTEGSIVAEEQEAEHGEGGEGGEGAGGGSGSLGIGSLRGGGLT